MVLLYEQYKRSVLMAKAKDNHKRESYSVRLNPDLLIQIKHIAVDEKKTISELIEEGISGIVESRKGKDKSA
jgi:hypothetical protein